MGLAARQARTIRSPGCFVCEALNDEMITLADHGVVVCRPCVTRVGRAILAMRSPVAARLWPVSTSVLEPQRVALPPNEVNVEELFATFKLGVEKHIGAEDALTHLDLGRAYGEMGLMADAIREVATALGERAPRTIASEALNWILSPERAHPDALRTIASMLRDE